MINGISAGEDLTLDRFPVVHHKISEKHYVFDVELEGDGHKLTIQTFKDLVSVQIDQAVYKDFGASSGMMGEFGTGKMLARNSTVVITDPVAFGKEWQGTLVRKR